MVPIIVTYLMIGCFLGYIFIYSGNYRIRSTSGRKVNSLWKLEKFCTISFFWPYVILKGFLNS